MALDTSKVLSNAVGISIAVAVGKKKSTALSGGISLAVNVIDNNINSYISGSTINADGDVTLDADSNADIWALSIAASGAAAIAGSSDSGGALSVAGAFAVNTVSNKSEAYITNVGALRSSVTTLNLGAITLSAEDNTSILANAGGLSFAGAKGSSAAAGAIGGSLAVNVIANEVRAYISGSTILSDSTLDLSAISTGYVWALTLAGSVALAAGSSGAGRVIAGAGSVSVNTVANKVESYITNSGTQRSNVTVSNDDSLIMRAIDDTNIVANAGAVSIGASTGTGKSLAVTIGFSTAINTIANQVRSYISGSTVLSNGLLDMSALSSANIWSLTIAGSGGVAAGSGGGIAASFAGSGSVNTVANTIESYITNSGTQRSDVTVGNGNTLSLFATDDTDILGQCRGLECSSSRRSGWRYSRYCRRFGRRKYYS